MPHGLKVFISFLGTILSDFLSAMLIEEIEHPSLQPLELGLWESNRIESDASTVIVNVITKSYFCKPYHSWEKGNIENTNGLIRRFIPKKTDLATIDQKQLDHIANLLNHRPRKCLGFKTPAAVFLKLSSAIPP